MGTWIYASSYPAAGKPPTVGVRIINNSSLSDVGSCVFGPGLSYNLIGSTSTTLNVSQCLFIDAATANVIIGADATPASPGQYNFNACTSFLTKKNGNEQAHYNFWDQRYHPSTGSSINVTNSVVYGGIVGIPVADGKMGANNFQYGVTGNTSTLAAQQVDPQCKTNVAAIPDNASVLSLENTDFSLSATSPATKASSGSLLTSVALLKQALAPRSCHRQSSQEIPVNKRFVKHKRPVNEAGVSCRRCLALIGVPLSIMRLYMANMFKRDTLFRVLNPRPVLW